MIYIQRDLPEAVLTKAPTHYPLHGKVGSAFQLYLPCGSKPLADYPHEARVLRENISLI